jgi:trans-aconitate methyltransferase
VSCVADDAIYTARTLHTIPHRIRVLQVLSEIRKMSLKGFSYADVGCGGGSITQRIVEASSPVKTVAYDANPDLINAASRLFPAISFRVWSLCENKPPNDTYDLVTCLETLEHVDNLKCALDNLLQMTARVLLITVPIEIGFIGSAKFVAKAVLGRKPLTDEHAGSPLAYLKALVTGSDISVFRVHLKGNHWMSHTGFDYRRIDACFESQRVNFVARNRGWNRFYRVSKSKGSV